MKIDREHLLKFQSFIALAMLLLVMSLLSENFLTAENCLNILRQISVNLCLSIGMTLIILTAGIDLSVGAILALSGAVAAGLLKNGLPIEALDIRLQFTVLGSIVAGLATGSGGRPIQWNGRDTFSIAPIRGDAGHVQHCPWIDHAVDRWISGHGFGAKFWRDRHRRLPADSGSRLDCRRAGGYLRVAHLG